VHEFIERMDREGISINPQSYEYLFKMFGMLRALFDGKLFHNRMQRFSNNNRLIDNCILQIHYRFK